MSINDDKGLEDFESKKKMSNINDDINYGMRINFLRPIVDRSRTLKIVKGVVIGIKKYGRNIVVKFPDKNISYSEKELLSKIELNPNEDDLKVANGSHVWVELDGKKTLEKKLTHEEKHHRIIKKLESIQESLTVGR